MSESIFLKCEKCQAKYSLDNPIWRCKCGHHLAISNIDINYSPDESFCNFYRYKFALPFLKDYITIGESMTPLSKVSLYGRDCYLKIDYLLPTGSYKDRGVAVMMSMLRQWGVEKIVEDSSGNAGSSVAAYASIAEIDCDVYIPSYTSQGKALQIEMYGSNLIKIEGSREETAIAAFAAGEKSFYASHNWSPFFEHGVKTYIYEIYEQMGHTLPDYIIVPCGNGSLVTSAYIAFSELLNAKLITKLPKIIAVQSANCAPLATAYENKQKVASKIEKKDTLAEGISSSSPIKDREILDAVYKTNGLFVTVDDNEIWQALRVISKKGVFIELTSCVAIAAFIKLTNENFFKESDKVVVELTGNGLKSADKILTL